MKLVFIYGPPAAGKFTIAKRVAERTGFSLFHNHLVVDAVGAVFPFGSESFVRLREVFWLEVMGAAANEGRSMIFTFQPEASVSDGFTDHVEDVVRKADGELVLVRLKLSLDAQLERIANTDRERFGKLRDAELLKQLHTSFEACEERMPEAALEIDTAVTEPGEAAARICTLL